MDSESRYGYLVGNKCIDCRQPRGDYHASGCRFWELMGEWGRSRAGRFNSKGRMSVGGGGCGADWMDWSRVQ